MEYRLPKEDDEKEIKELLEEYFRNGEREVIICQDILLDDFAKWVSYMKTNANEGNNDWGKSLLLLCLKESRLIGILCIRYCLTKELEKQYGNIGYSVRPSERNQGYATKMLQFGLKVCEENGMDRVILGCHSDNMASVSVIKKCGGSYAYSLWEADGRENQYYEIVISRC